MNKIIEKDIPWHKAPEGTTHYARDTGEWSECWYHFDGKEWFGISLPNAYKIEEDGWGEWCSHGTVLKRPMDSLVKRPV